MSLTTCLLNDKVFFSQGSFIFLIILFTHKRTRNCIQQLPYCCCNYFYIAEWVGLNCSSITPDAIPQCVMLSHNVRKHLELFRKYKRNSLYLSYLPSPAQRCDATKSRLTCKNPLQRNGTLCCHRVEMSVARLLSQLSEEQNRYYTLIPYLLSSRRRQDGAHSRVDVECLYLYIWAEEILV